jgi:hypothetical protein
MLRKERLSEMLRSFVPMKSLALAAAVVGTLAAGASQAQAISSAVPFQSTGFIQGATLESNCAKNQHCGGTITVDGRTIMVPKGVTITLASSKLAWEEVLGLAAPVYGFEATVSGSRVGDLFVATQLTLNPMALNGSSGFSNGIETLFAPQ